VTAMSALPVTTVPWLNVLTAGQRFVQIAGRGVAGNHSASNAAITMRRIPAYESRFRTSAMRRQVFLVPGLTKPVERGETGSRLCLQTYR
jgi:hypothetical protein